LEGIDFSKTVTVDKFGLRNISHEPNFNGRKKDGGGARLCSALATMVEQPYSSPPQQQQQQGSGVASPGSGGGGGMAMPSTGDYVDLHELAKGWKAAIARAKDPATR
jgi:hypothetical protein